MALVSSGDVDGLVRPRAVDHAAIARWTIQGLAHGAIKARGRDRLVSTSVAIIALGLSPIVWPAFSLVLLARARAGRTRFYMTPERDVVLAISTKADGWHIADHVAARPGRGRGRALRSALLPALLPLADENRIPIHAGAASSSLARAYRDELPGLLDVGPAVPRGRRLRRDPIG